MTSNRKLRRRLMRWYRWSAKEPRLGSLTTRGFERAYNASVRAHNRRADERASAV